MLSQVLWEMDLTLSKDEVQDLVQVLDPGRIGSIHELPLV